MDWGVHAYDPTGTNGVDPQNGGIVGTVSYDTTRNELDPQYAAAEDWQPGVSTCRSSSTPRSPAPRDGRAVRRRRPYELDADGSLRQGKLLNTYVTRDLGAARPAARPATSTATRWSTRIDEQVLRRDQEATACTRGPAEGIQFGTYPTDQGTPDANFGAAVDGNYGFGDGCFNGTLDAHRPGDPDVRSAATSPRCRPATTSSTSEIPTTPSASPMYKFTREEDINIGNGDQIVPQVPPPACAGALHTVDVAGDRTDGYRALVGDGRTARRRRDRPGLDARRQPDLRRHRRLALRGHGQAAVRHQARRRSTTASRSCRCSTSSPTCRCPAASAA